MYGTTIVTGDDAQAAVAAAPLLPMPRRIAAAVALLVRACFPTAQSVARAVRRPLAHEIGQAELTLLGKLLVAYNDDCSTRHSDILSVLGQAIADAEKRRRRRMRRCGDPS